jgi:hypothetical protein
MDLSTKKFRKDYNRNMPKQADYDIHKRLLELKVLQGFLESENQKDKQIDFMFQIDKVKNEIRNIIGVQELGR